MLRYWNIGIVESWIEEHYRLRSASLESESFRYSLYVTRYYLLPLFVHCPLLLCLITNNNSLIKVCLLMNNN